MKRAALILALVATACGKFETESIVLDLRVLAIRTNVQDPTTGTDTNEADEVIDVDMENVDLNTIRNQLKDVSVYGLVSDPSERRKLHYTWTMCLANDDGRCDLGEPHLQFAPSELEDPETYLGAPQLATAIIPLRTDTTTAITALSMIQSDIQKNPVDALGGVDLTLELRIGGVDADPDDDVYAMKKLRISPRIPGGRTPNTNPDITHLDGSLTGHGANDQEREVVQSDDINDNTTRCAAKPSQTATATLRPGDVITLFPQAEASREMYVTPGLDGSTIMLTETLSFQWLSTRGSWSDETTGGGHDILGNQSLLGSDWKSPSVTGPDPTPVQIWMIERDERNGVTWRETCIYAIPESP